MNERKAQGSLKYRNYRRENEEEIINFTHRPIYGATTS
jgi:hypothetical protein